MGHEEAFAKAFITSEKRACFIQYLATPRRRKEMLERLSHDLPYIPGLAIEVQGTQDFPDGLEALLKEKGLEQPAM